jgi:hypothetical protein
MFSASPNGIAALHARLTQQHPRTSSIGIAVHRFLHWMHAYIQCPSHLMTGNEAEDHVRLLGDALSLIQSSEGEDPIATGKRIMQADPGKAFLCQRLVAMAMRLKSEFDGVATMHRGINESVGRVLGLVGQASQVCALFGLQPDSIGWTPAAVTIDTIGATTTTIATTTAADPGTTIGAGAVAATGPIPGTAATQPAVVTFPAASYVTPIPARARLQPPVAPLSSRTITFGDLRAAAPSAPASSAGSDSDGGVTPEDDDCPSDYEATESSTGGGAANTTNITQSAAAATSASIGSGGSKKRSLMSTLATMPTESENKAAAVAPAAASPVVKETTAPMPATAVAPSAPSSGTNASVSAVAAAAAATGAASTAQNHDAPESSVAKKQKIEDAKKMLREQTEQMLAERAKRVITNPGRTQPPEAERNNFTCGKTNVGQSSNHVCCVWGDEPHKTEKDRWVVYLHMNGVTGLQEETRLMKVLNLPGGFDAYKTFLKSLPLK